MTRDHESGVELETPSDYEPAALCCHFGGPPGCRNLALFDATRARPVPCEEHQ